MNVFIDVTNIDADVEGKVVKVECAEDTDEQELLQALLKWSNASGKSVELVQS